MKKTEFENYFQKVHPDLYGLACALCIDDQTARNVVYESITVLFEQYEELIESFCLDSKTNPGHFKSLKVTLFKEIFKIYYKKNIDQNCSEKSSDDFFSLDSVVCDKDLIDYQDNDLNSVQTEFKAFYRMSLYKRLGLYLRSKTTLSWDEISFIFELPRYQVLLIVMQAREAMARRIGLSFEKRHSGSLTGPLVSLNEQITDMKESTYLYHEDSKDLYLDSFKRKEKCRFSKNAYSFIDSDNGSDERFYQFKDHMKECLACQEEIEFVKNTFMQIDKKTPLIKVQRGHQLEYEKFLYQLIKRKGLPRASAFRLFRPFLKGIRKFSLVKN